jgi:hypothetical protein
MQSEEEQSWFSAALLDREREISGSGEELGRHKQSDTPALCCELQALSFQLNRLLILHSKEFALSIRCIVVLFII